MPAKLNTKYPLQARRVSAYVYMWKGIDSTSVSMILQLYFWIVQRRCSIVFHFFTRRPARTHANAKENLEVWPTKAHGQSNFVFSLLRRVKPVLRGQDKKNVTYIYFLIELTASQVRLQLMWSPQLISHLY
jgi:hypothetical protein